LLRQFFHQSEFVLTSRKEDVVLLEFKVKIELLADSELLKKATNFLIDKFKEKIVIKVKLCREIDFSVVNDELKRTNERNIETKKLIEESSTINKILFEFDGTLVENSVGQN
jgi:hypothetical protein